MATQTAEEKAAAEKLARDAQDAKDAADAKARNANRTPFVFAGRQPGVVFGITGEGFGGQGTLLIAGVPVQTTLWTDKNIRGVLPANVEPGPVVIRGTSGNEQRGVWPPV